MLTRDLSEYVANPDVTVVIEGIGSKHVFVVGEVVRSGPVPLGKDVRVLDAISTAGGFGHVGVRDGEPFLEVRHGEIEIGEIDYIPAAHGGQ